MDSRMDSVQPLKEMSDVKFENDLIKILQTQSFEYM